MKKIYISTEFIKLDQFLKWINAVESGVEAKFLIIEGMVKVNNEVELRRGRKLFENDIVEIEGKEYKVKIQEK